MNMAASMAITFANVPNKKVEKCMICFIRVDSRTLLWYEWNMFLRRIVRTEKVEGGIASNSFSEHSATTDRTLDH